MDETCFEISLVLLRTFNTINDAKDQCEIEWKVYIVFVMDGGMILNTYYMFHKMMCLAKKNPHSTPHPPPHPPKKVCYT